MIVPRRRLFAVASAAVFAAAGCHLFSRVQARKVPPLCEPTFSQYHLDGWRWESANRVLVLPFRNESEYTRAGDEVRAAFSSELQREGRFEIVAAPGDDRAILASCIRQDGRFNEIAMLDLARAARADVVVFGTVSFYSPYPRPRIGLVIQAVGPAEAKVVASIDGLWDTTDAAIADRVRTYYRQRPRAKPPWIRNHTIAADDGFADEIALDSPALFQRAICREAVLALLGLPVPGIAGPSSGAMPADAAVERTGCSTSKCP